MLITVLSVIRETLRDVKSTIFNDYKEAIINMFKEELPTKLNERKRDIFKETYFISCLLVFIYIFSNFSTYAVQETHSVKAIDCIYQIAHDDCIFLSRTAFKLAITIAYKDKSKKS